MGVPAGPWYIDDTLTFTVATHRVDTGALTDADSVPSYRVYEDETGTAILTGSMAKLDDTNTTGFYSEQITLSAANGFEVGKSYAIYVSAAVNSVTGGQTFNFKVIAATYPANVTQFGGSAGTFASGRPEVNTSHIAGSAVSTSSAQIGVNVVNAGGTAWASGSITAGVIAADAIGASELAADAIAEIADAVWDEDATAHQTQGTFGQAIGDPGADSDSIWALANTNLDATVSSRLATAGYTAPPSAASIADAVWDEAQADHVGVGTFGITASEIADILVDTAEIGAAGAGLTALATQASVNTVDTVVDAIKAKTDLIPGDMDGLSLTEMMTLMGAALLGKASGLGTATAVFRAADDSKDRITATVDADGNRTAVTLDAA